MNKPELTLVITRNTIMQALFIDWPGRSRDGELVQARNRDRVPKFWLCAYQKCPLWNTISLTGPDACFRALGWLDLF